MGLPSSSVIPFFISIYKDSKTLLILLMKSSSLSTVAFPGNKWVEGGEGSSEKYTQPVSITLAPDLTGSPARMFGLSWANAKAVWFLSSRSAQR